MEGNFNVGSQMFTRITDLSELQPGKKYLIRMRELGQVRIDQIGTFTESITQHGKILISMFKALYKRNARLDDNDPYSQWSKPNAANDPSATVYGYPFEKGYVQVFDLGEMGKFVTEERSPDEIPQIVNTLKGIEALQKIQPEAEMYKNSDVYTQLDAESIKDLRGYLGPKGGRKKSRKNKSKKSKRRINKSKKSKRRRH